MDKNPKKLPPVLLKKALGAKVAHIRNLERYASKHSNNEPVLVVVGVEIKI